MYRYIEMPWGQVSAYNFWINIGSVIGSIGLLVSIYLLVKSKKDTVLIYLSMLAVMLLGAFPASAVRGLTYGGVRSLSDFFGLFIYQGSHFIGRVLFCIIIYPLCFRVLFRSKKNLCGAMMDRFCLFFTFQHIFNRIACIFNGCCVGKYYDGLFSIQYLDAEKTGPGYSYPVYPTRLFEIVGMIILFLILFLRYRKGKRILVWFEVGFGVVIFLSEFMMDASGTIQIAGLTVIQYAAILLWLIPVISLWKPEVNINKFIKAFRKGEYMNEK